jgi:AcrR family transcriptional regulator
MTGERFRGRAETARPTLRAVQRDQTRRRIRAAARKLFTSTPFDQVSMEDIARGAEIGRTTIYLHYPSKSPLLVELLAEDWARQLAMFDRLTSAGPKVATRRAMRGWLRVYAQGMRDTRGMFRMYTFTLGMDEELGRLHHLHRERLIRLFGRRLPGLVAQADVGAGQRRAAAASHALIAHIEHYGGLVAGDAEPEVVEAATDVLLDAMEGFMVPA